MNTSFIAAPGVGNAERLRVIFRIDEFEDSIALVVYITFRISGL